jgi:hypothetical protein
MEKKLVLHKVMLMTRGHFEWVKRMSGEMVLSAEDSSHPKGVPACRGSSDLKGLGMSLAAGTLPEGHIGQSTLVMWLIVGLGPHSISLTSERLETKVSHAGAQPCLCGPSKKKPELRAQLASLLAILCMYCHTSVPGEISTFLRSPLGKDIWKS